MVVLGIMVAALSTVVRPRSGTLEVKTAAMLTASRLRDLRSSAIAAGKDRLATIDVGDRTVQFNDGRAPVALQRGIAVAVTGADSERRSPTTAKAPAGSSMRSCMIAFSRRPMA